MQALPSADHPIKFVGLDILRCCAALSIVIYHSTLSYKEFLPRAFAMLLHGFPVGVDFFFIISGFLITYLLLAEKEQTGAISLSRFYLRRALRIFPLYYIIVALAWWLHHAGHPEINFYSYLYFIGNFWMIDHDWTVATLNPLWSICIEEQFYVIIPLLVWLIPTRRLPWLFGGIIALSIGFRVYATLTPQHNYWMTIYCHTLSRCDVLAVGCWLAWRHFTRPIRLQLPRWTLLAAVMFLVLLLSIIDTSDFTSLNLATFKKYLYVLPLVFIFCYTLFTPHAATPPGKGVQVLNYLGKISYGLYMYHSPVIFLLDENPAIYHDSQSLRLFLILAITVVIASLSYYLFEKQILRLKNRFEVIRTVRA